MFGRVDAGASAVKAILSARETPTVIFCGSDLIAMGAMSALEETGVNIPEDISIVGIDNISFAILARPPFTTINVLREQLWAAAFQALERMQQLKRHKGAEYILETELVVRKSTAPARRKKRRASKRGGPNLSGGSHGTAFFGRGSEYAAALRRY